jgi:hypothetical protein
MRHSDPRIRVSLWYRSIRSTSAVRDPTAMMTTSWPRCPVIRAPPKWSLPRPRHRPRLHRALRRARAPHDVGVRVPDEGVDARGGRSGNFNDGARPQIRAVPPPPLTCCRRRRLARCRRHSSPSRFADDGHSCAESVCPAAALGASVNAHRGYSARWRVLCASNSSTSVHRYSTSCPTLVNVGTVPR